MADINYPFVMPPTGPAENQVVREMFDAVTDAVENIPADSEVVHTTGNETVGGVKTFTDGIVTPSINTSGVWGLRNRIINGAMRIDQRNEGAALSITGGTNQYSLDRWFGLENSDGVFSITRSTATPPTGFTHFLRVTTTTADSSLSAAQQNYVSQRIEGLNIYDFLLGNASAKTLTLSFWVRSSLTGTFSVGFLNSADDRAYPTTYTISSANTWEQKTISLTGDTTGTWLTTNGIGLKVIFDLGSGSNFEGTANTWAASDNYRVASSTNIIGTLNATWDITGVQLEVGSKATSFEYRPEEVELQLCQRYFAKTFLIGTAVAQAAGNEGAIAYRVRIAGVSNQSEKWDFPVRMRTTPTFVYFSPGAATSAWWNATDGAASGASSTISAYSSDRTVVIQNAQAAGDGVNEAVGIHATATAEL